MPRVLETVGERGVALSIQHAFDCKPDSLGCKSENFVSRNLIIAWASKQPEKAAELQRAIVLVVTVLPPTALANFRPRSLKIHSPTVITRFTRRIFTTSRGLSYCSLRALLWNKRQRTMVLLYSIMFLTCCTQGDRIHG